MRLYVNDTTKELAGVICNRCQKKLKVKNGILSEGAFEGVQRFGYFSKRDGMKHSFDLCEECYDKMIAEFAIPVKEEELSELL